MRRHIGKVWCLIVEKQNMISVKQIELELYNNLNFTLANVSSPQQRKLVL